MSKLDITKLSRRELIKLSMLCGAGMLVPGRTWAQQCAGFIDQTPHDIGVRSALRLRCTRPSHHLAVLRRG